MKYFQAVFLGYFVGATVVYILIMGLDFSQYYSYLFLAWTAPGERPTFMQWGGFLAAILSLIGVWLYSFLLRHYKNRKNKNEFEGRNT